MERCSVTAITGIGRVYSRIIRALDDIATELTCSDIAASNGNRAECRLKVVYWAATLVIGEGKLALCFDQNWQYENENEQLPQKRAVAGGYSCVCHCGILAIETNTIRSVSKVGRTTSWELRDKQKDKKKLSLAQRDTLRD